MKAKDLRKMIAHYLKANQNLTAPGQKSLTALQAKLHYMKIISELRSFGGKLFIATLVVSDFHIVRISVILLVTTVPWEILE